MMSLKTESELLQKPTKQIHKGRQMKKLILRLSVYFAGLFVMTIGIALSVKSNLGVSPVSSIPYTMTRVFGIEMGNATIIFHCALVLIQLLILRKNFSLLVLLQIPVGIVFGKFTTLCNFLADFFPTPEFFILRLALSLLSCVFVAIGIFFYVPANIVPLAGEGCMGVISRVTKIEFAKVKIAFDCLMVLVSVATCLFALHNFGSVGIGTVIAAILVGFILGFITKKFSKVKERVFGF